MEDNKISCPKCNHTFGVGEVLNTQLELERKKFRSAFDAKIADMKQQHQLETDKLIAQKLLEEKQRMDQALRDEIQKDFQLKMGLLNEELEKKRKESLELQKVAFENEKLKNDIQQHQLETEKLIAQKLLEEKQKLDQALRDEIQKDFQLKMGLLNEELEKKRKESNDLQKVAFENEKLKNEMQQQRMQMEIEFQRKKNEEMEQVAKQLKDSITNEYEMKLKDREFQFNKMREQIEEMKRKAEQGSMQIQGEVQELALEEMLGSYFPHDVIQPVPKGVSGADSIQIVKNFSGIVCGKIVYESKRTKNFDQKWIDKLKHDMRELGASVAVLVTAVMPADMERFGMREGIYICTFAEVKSLAFVLREGLLKIQSISEAQENREDKLHLLYDYISGDEFRNRLEAVAEGFKNVKDSITRERIFMEKQWAEREKQMEKAMTSTIKLFGSVRGIVGTGMGDLKLLD